MDNTLNDFNSTQGLRFIVAPDSFKGTLSADTVAEEITAALKEKIPNAQVVALPIADGGEGTTQCFKRIFANSHIINQTVIGPNFTPVLAQYLLCGDIAVIETAAAAGLPQANPRDAKSTTTYGVGQLISAAVSRGARHIILGLGGSATNDCGAGCAAALGIRFFNKDNVGFIPVGGTLNEVARIERNGNFDITALCDVTNPLYGEKGAAYVYAPQKGATPEEVPWLDDNLKSFAEVLSRDCIPVGNIAGGGAAGGLGAGVVALLGGSLQRGIDTILQHTSFEQLAQKADCVITGEGSLDAQSLNGKVIDGIIAKSGATPVVALVGISALEAPKQYGLSAVYETNPQHKPFAQIKANALQDLRVAARLMAADLHRKLTH